MYRWIYIFLMLVALLMPADIYAGRKMRVPTCDQIPLVGVNAMMQDSEGYVWYATTEGGICRDNGYQVDVFRNDRENPLRLGHSNGVLSLCETSNGDICFGTRENIYLLRKSDYSIVPFDTAVVFGKVKLIHTTANGGLVAYTGSGICRYDKSYRRISVEPSPGDSVIDQEAAALYTSFVDRHGNKWELIDEEPYISVSSDSFINRLDQDGKSGKVDLRRCVGRNGTLFKSDYDGIEVGGKYISGLSNVRQMAAAPDGGIYFITAFSALSYMSESGLVIPLVAGTESKTLCVTPDGDVWLGGWQGQIWKYNRDTGTLDLDEIASTYNSDPVNGIVSDMLGILWILTDKRIKSYNPSTGQYRIITNNNYLAEERKFGTIKFADDSVVVDGKDAILKIGQGIRTKKEQVVLSTVVVDGKSEYVRIDKDELVLPANAVNVELAFTTFDYLNAPYIEMSYRINDGEWVNLPVGQNIVRLTSLSKGEYKLDVKARNSESWDVSEGSLTIHRLPAWRESWWAYTIYAIVLIVIVVLGDRFWQRFKATQNKLAELQSRLDSYLLKDDTSLESVAENITDNNADKDFIDRVISLIEDNIGNTDFDIDFLCREMAMSRSTLYRKFPEITGQKPTEFIRSIRLKKAAIMIKESRYSISEIANMCGFASPSYFNRRFKEMFGVAPTDYR